MYLAYLGCMVTAALALLAAVDPAWAAEAQEIPEWRQWWDLAWKILNFLVLAFLIVKMAKQPLKDFISNQRQAISEQLAEMEERKKEALAEQEKITQMTAGLAKELEEYQNALAETAAKEREAMLEDAESESQLIMDRASVWADQALAKAKQALAAELLELAAQMAAETIQKNINDQDRQHLFDHFNQGLKESAVV